VWPVCGDLGPIPGNVERRSILGFIDYSKEYSNVDSDWAEYLDIYRMPMWPLPAALLLPIVVLAYRVGRARRWKEGACRRCGYLLFGLTNHICPECGTRFDSAGISTIG
jgi:hypothetical protein